MNLDRRRTHRPAVVQFLHEKPLGERILPLPLAAVRLLKEPVVIERKSDVPEGKRCVGRIAEHFPQPEHADGGDAVPVTPVVQSGGESDGIGTRLFGSAEVSSRAEVHKLKCRLGNDPICHGAKQSEIRGVPL
jgi:hypothetical protein